jgi:hypothetical protein
MAKTRTAKLPTSGRTTRKVVNAIYTIILKTFVIVKMFSEMGRID